MISKDLSYEMIAMIISHDENILNNKLLLIWAFISRPEPIWNKTWKQKGVHSNWAQIHPLLIQIQLQNGFKFIKFLPW